MGKKQTDPMRQHFANVVEALLASTIDESSIMKVTRTGPGTIEVDVMHPMSLKSWTFRVKITELPKGG